MPDDVHFDPTVSSFRKRAEHYICCQGLPIIVSYLDIVSVVMTLAMSMG